MAIKISFPGQVILTALANVRHGRATTTAPVQRKLQPNTSVTVAGVVAGEAVQGNSLWYLLDGDDYLWSGACGPLAPGTDTAVTSPPSSPAAFVPPSATPPAVPMVIDLYHGDVATSFGQAYAAGVRGIIHKATTGASGRDDLYEDRRKDAKAAGMLWGAYHWGTGAPAADQVRNFLDVAKPEADTLMALDFETTIGNQMTLDIAREFLRLILEQTGRRAVLYSGNVIKEALGNQVDSFFGEHRLWLAQYGPRPEVQRSWSTYWLWQYAERQANIPGLPGNAAGALDLDHFAGTEAELAAQWAS